MQNEAAVRLAAQAHAAPMLAPPAQNPDLVALGQALFTIAVDVQPLAQAIATPARAARLHDAVASMSPAVLAYRHLDSVQTGLLQWLAARR